jgi:hypothetical protein
MNNQNNNQNLNNAGNDQQVTPPNFWGEDLMQSTYDNSTPVVKTNSQEVNVVSPNAGQPYSPLLEQGVVTQQSSLESQPVVSNQPNQVNVVDDNLASQQPLAVTGNEGITIDANHVKTEETTNAKYFQTVTIEDNRLRAADAVPVSVSSSSSNGQTNSDIQDYVKKFVGDKYQAISMSPFSFWAGLFGPLYFYYRKMYLYGIFIAIVNLLLMLLTFVNGWIYFGASLAEFIILGLITNQMYLKFANKKVISIVATNPNANTTSLQTMCQSSGGTSIFLAILLNIITNVASSFVFVLLGGAAILTSILNGLNTYTLHTDTSAKVEDVIEYTLPSTFVQDENDDSLYSSDYGCQFKVGLVAKHKTSKDLVTYMADADKRYSRVSTYETITGDVWDLYDFTSNGTHEMHIARKFGEHIVLIDYYSSNVSDDDVCDTYLKEIMGSIKEK